MTEEELEDTIEGMKEAIDVDAQPENMSPEEAKEYYEGLASHCSMMARSL